LIDRADLVAAMIREWPRADRTSLLVAILDRWPDLAGQAI
jgi:hypothetical protein